MPCSFLLLQSRLSCTVFQAVLALARRSLKLHRLSSIPPAHLHRRSRNCSVYSLFLSSVDDMGCGGSKQQDVATGNTVTRRLLRRSSSVAKGKRSEKKGADATEVTDTAAAGHAKKAAPAVGEAKLASRGSSSEEYFSSRRESDSLDAVAAGTEVASDSLPGEYVDANVNVKAGEEAAGSTVSKKDNETSAVVELEKKDEEKKEKDKEETAIDKEKEEDDGKSVGKLSVDFKEALSLEEKVEAEKENIQATKTTTEENSGGSKTAS